MRSLIIEVKEKIAQAFEKAFPKNAFSLETIEVVKATDGKFGHYQCNSAMRLCQHLGAAPKEIAKVVCEALEGAFFSKVESAGPGFINVWVSPVVLQTHLMRLGTQARCGVPSGVSLQRVIVEFSSPNIAKEMHVGHLRSTIIGDCLARLFEWMGHDVLRLNHLGDWGTAFGMLIAYLKRFHPKVISQETEADLPELMQCYRRAKKTFDEDPLFKQEAREQVVALQSGDPVAMRAWKCIVAISEKSYQEIYRLLAVQLHSRGESFYNSMLAQVVEDFQKSGLLENDKGAQCVFLEGFEGRDKQPLPFMIQKSDGGYNYATTDLAALKHRIAVEKAQRILYVVDMGQSLHFKMLEKAAQAVGYLDVQKTEFRHVAFGLVLGNDGKKFKTRSGDTEKLIDLLAEAVSRAKAILIERNVCDNSEMLEELGTALGINAVKYADLSCNRLSDYAFSYDKMLRFEGNTAAFLMYALVRIKSIQRKILDKNIDWESLSLDHPSELRLGVHVAQFSELLIGVTQDLCPNRLADYLFQLAEKFNAFFRDCRVEGSKEQASRLALCAVTARVLETGFTLLGLKTVERM